MVFPLARIAQKVVVDFDGEDVVFQGTNSPVLLAQVSHVTKDCTVIGRQRFSFAASLTPATQARSYSAPNQPSLSTKSDSQQSCIVAFRARLRDSKTIRPIGSVPDNRLRAAAWAPIIGRQNDNR